MTTSCHQMIVTLFRVITLEDHTFILKGGRKMQNNTTHYFWKKANSPSGTVASFPAAQVGRLGWGGWHWEGSAGVWPRKIWKALLCPLHQGEWNASADSTVKIHCVGDQGHPSVSHTRLRSGSASPEPSWGANLNLPPPVQEELFNVYYLSLAQIRKGSGFGKFLPENWN